MSNLNCLNSIVNSCLVLNIDIANPKSWNGNTGYTITSLNKYCDATVTKFDLCDWGLTQYDVARATSLTASTEINYTDNVLDLESIKYNDASGNTFSIGTITDQFDSYTGSYLYLSGGSYFQNFFKLYGYEYELMPYRFNDGFTIETWLYIDDNTFNNMSNVADGTFLYFGTRAENKFNGYYSGNTGYTSCSGATLINDHPTNVELGVDNNVLSFKFNEDRTLQYNYIDSDFIIKSCASNPVTQTGWTQITITFTPNEKIRNFDEVLDCAPARDGRLVTYVNGRKFWDIQDFPEFWFKPMDTAPDKQIGVPYVISWGGGSYGLKYSYNYPVDTGSTIYEQNINNSELLIESNFNGSFTGGIQILRFHSCALNFAEVKHNFKIDNERFGLPTSFGGRIIDTFNRVNNYLMNCSFYSRAKVQDLNVSVNNLNCPINNFI